MCESGCLGCEICCWHPRIGDSGISRGIYAPSYFPQLRQSSSNSACPSGRTLDYVCQLKTRNETRLRIRRRSSRRSARSSGGLGVSGWGGGLLVKGEGGRQTHVLVQVHVGEEGCTMMLITDEEISQGGRAMLLWPMSRLGAPRVRTAATYTSGPSGLSGLWIFSHPIPSYPCHGKGVKGGRVEKRIRPMPITGKYASSGG